MIHGNLATKAEVQVLKQANSHIAYEGTKTISRPTVDQKIIEKQDKLLKIFSNNDFWDAVWHVTVNTSNRSSKISFPECEKEDGVLLRIAVLEYLAHNASADAGKRFIRNCKELFRFLSEHNLVIENTRSGTVDLFVKYLKNRTELNNEQRNGMIRAMAMLLDICSRYCLLQGTGVIDCSYRFDEYHQPQRAPDQCVIDALDNIFFDVTRDIPNAYRCIYFLLRLIINRISEVLAMRMDCLSASDADVFAVEIPTKKETPFHLPVYQKYHRKLSGWCEGLLYQTIKNQQVLANQGDLPEVCQGYLFVSPYSKKLVSPADFNNYLDSVIIENQIVDSAGELAHVTSHMFRHVAIGERLRNDIISPIEAMLESNHSNVRQTIDYGYLSRNDEGYHLGSILRAAQGFAWEGSDDGMSSDPQEVYPNRYERLMNQPFARIIPGYGICCDASCKPRYEQCFSCPNFEPDKAYKDHFVEAYAIVEKKIALLEKNNGSKKAIQFNKAQLEVFRRFIKKIDAQEQRRD